VAAASVIAKVSRDRMMRDLHERYPLYGFDRHKGYVTDEHVAALAEHGPSPVHRYSFVNVTRAAALAVPAVPTDPAELLEPAELLGDADPAVDDPAGALVAAGLGPAGALGENERRMDS
jgi:ribonuclease HII